MSSMIFCTFFVFFSILPIIQSAIDSNYYSDFYGDEETPLKRALSQSKRHISPSYDIEADAGSLRSLLAVGKRQVSMASDIGNQMQMYNHLFDAGKKKRSAIISPAYNFRSSFGLSDALEKAGRK